MQENLTSHQIAARVAFSTPRSRRHLVERFIAEAHKQGLVYIHSWEGGGNAWRPSAIWSIQTTPFEFGDAPRIPSVWKTLNDNYKSPKP
jgi:hypothetical protein